MKAHSTPGLTLVHRIGIIPFHLGFGKLVKKKAGYAVIRIFGLLKP
jgi:hypothetical protein